MGSSQQRVKSSIRERRDGSERVLGDVTEILEEVGVLAGGEVKECFVDVIEGDGVEKKEAGGDPWVLGDLFSR